VPVSHSFHLIHLRVCILPSVTAFFVFHPHLFTFSKRALADSRASASASATTTISASCPTSQVFTCSTTHSSTIATPSQCASRRFASSHLLLLSLSFIQSLFLLSPSHFTNAHTLADCPTSASATTTIDVSLSSSASQAFIHSLRHSLPHHCHSQPVRVSQVCIFSSVTSLLVFHSILLPPHFTKARILTDSPTSASATTTPSQQLPLWPNPTQKRL
jgi:hypothetical protein